MKFVFSICQIVILTLLVATPMPVGDAAAQELDRESAARLVEPPYKLGDSIGSGAWNLINLDGRVAGYVFESEPLAPLPGFSGAPINMLVSITVEGKFIDVEIISQSEPIFVSGLGQAPFEAFVAQYKGHSIADRLAVGVPYGKKSSGSSLTYLDGVTKATASVRIAHESIMAAAFAIAREKMAGLGARKIVVPNLHYKEQLSWNDLVSTGLASRRLVTNAEVDSAFLDTIWEDDDPLAKENPDGKFLDLWVIYIGAPAIAKVVLTKASLEELGHFREISPDEELILVIDNGRHGLFGENFVRNASPDLISAKQDGFPISLRDSDLDFKLAEGIPAKAAIILRTDRRLGFDPSRNWELSVREARKHGFFRPEIGTVDFSVVHSTDKRFFVIQSQPVTKSAWVLAIQQRLMDLVFLSVGLILLLWLLMTRRSALAGFRYFPAMRFCVLAIVIGFIGWWGQGQLSIVTVIGVFRGIIEGRNMAFLLYDPFSLLLWAVVLISFIAWGRGLYCGWLCPFGAMQEFAQFIGNKLGLKQIRVPNRVYSKLVWLKYLVLAILIASAFATPALNNSLIEVEPFKTAVTTFFVREWYFIVYAAGLILSSMVLFKGFCRYLCPLGAFMAIGGLLRHRDWIVRREECGNPCQLCSVKCGYNAIRKTGEIRYDECFMCLDCVTIHDDPKQCVPLVLAAKSEDL